LLYLHFLDADRDDDCECSNSCAEKNNL